VRPFEHILVGAAETLDPGAMRTLTQATRLRLDPDGVLADDNRATSAAGSSASRPMAASSSSGVSSMPKAARWSKTAIDALSHGIASWRNALGFAAAGRRAGRPCRQAAALR